MNGVYELAAALRAQHRQPGDRVTFTHIPCRVDAPTVLARLRSSSLGGVLASDAAPLTHPERPWYVPIELIRASEAELVDVGVTASTWEPPTWDFTAGELVLRLVYGKGGATAQQRLAVRVSGDEVPSLTRIFYDNQRAETGYEGEDRIIVEPTAAQIDDFLVIIRDTAAAG